MAREVNTHPTIAVAMNVLVVDDDRSIRRTLEKFLTDLGYAVATAPDGRAALAALAATEYDAMLLDLGLPEVDGLEVLAQMQAGGDSTPVIVITARDDMSSTITAVQRGAHDYLVKPLDIERLKISLQRAVESRALTRRLDALVSTAARDYQVDNIVGRSPAIRDVYKTIGAVSTSNATVLIGGESGTGKELVARAIHYAGPNRAEPFVAVNCTAFPRELLESELFGHTRGAFTGAVADKMGRFQLAGAGTLFLDEIGELPVDLQAKLLRVLQERTFERVGDARPLAFRARVVAATHRNLTQMVQDGTFREDLYYRLRVVEIHLPSLRERREDIPVLVDHLLVKITREMHKSIRFVSRDAMEMLVAYPWPGNVRELENALTRAVVLAKGEILELADLPMRPEDAADLVDAESDENDDNDGRTSLASAAAAEDAHDGESLLPLREIERRHIVRVLTSTGWNKRRSCAILGITRPTLDRKIREFSLERPTATQAGSVARPSAPGTREGTEPYRGAER